MVYIVNHYLLYHRQSLEMEAMRDELCKAKTQLDQIRLQLNQSREDKAKVASEVMGAYPLCGSVIHGNVKVEFMNVVISLVNCWKALIQPSVISCSSMI